MDATVAGLPPAVMDLRNALIEDVLDRGAALERGRSARPLTKTHRAAAAAQIPERGAFKEAGSKALRRSRALRERLCVTTRRM